MDPIRHVSIFFFTVINVLHSYFYKFFLVQIYKDWIIPLTKEVEVQYLLRRLEEPSTFEEALEAEADTN